MRLISVVLLFVILTSCGSRNENYKNNPPSQTPTPEKNQILQNYSSSQLKDSLSGKGQKAIPVKLLTGVAVIELKVSNNFSPMPYSMGEKQGSNITLIIRRSNGQEYPALINTIEITYEGSVSFSVPADDTYVIDIGTSSLSKWILKIK